MPFYNSLSIKNFHLTHKTWNIVLSKCWELGHFDTIYFNNYTLPCPQNLSPNNSILKKCHKSALLRTASESTLFEIHRNTRSQYLSLNVKGNTTDGWETHLRHFHSSVWQPFRNYNLLSYSSHTLIQLLEVLQWCSIKCQRTKPFSISVIIKNESQKAI